MRWWASLGYGYGLSIAVHFGLAAGVSSIRKDHPRKATVVKVFEAKREKKKEPEPEKKEVKPPPPKRAEPPPPPKNTPPPPTNTSPTPAGHEAMAALPDFGISLGGGSEGGIAVPVAGMAANAAAQHAAGAAAPTEKKVRGTAPKPSDAADSCVEEPIKPKPVERVSPQASDEAKASNIEGVVTVECTVNASGDVVDARVTSGLGHGLDENAVVAAKRWKFSPATKCGKPVEAKYVIRMRFVAGD